VRETIALRPDRLKNLREQHGLSQRELAKVCGLGITAISKYERAEVDPSSSHLKVIAQQLEVTTDYLLGLTDDPRGLFDNRELTDEERTILQAFRRDRWVGVLRVVTEQIER
jgi:transcriptional regulator with XRE-family HTH domain